MGQPRSKPNARFTGELPKIKSGEIPTLSQRTRNGGAAEIETEGSFYELYFSDTGCPSGTLRKLEAA